MAKKLTQEQQVGLHDEIITQFGDPQTDFSLDRLDQTGNHFTSPRCRHCTTRDCIEQGPKCRQFRRTAIN